MAERKLCEDRLWQPELSLRAGRHIFWRWQNRRNKHLCKTQLFEGLSSPAGLWKYGDRSERLYEDRKEPGMGRAVRRIAGGVPQIWLPAADPELPGRLYRC